MYVYLTVVVCTLLLADGMGSHAEAHEPLFGLGPHTLYQYGVGLESEVKVVEGGLSLNNELLYGVTPDLAVTLVAPWVRRDDPGVSGFGDITLRSKWRFLRRDFPGGQDALALHFGMTLPTGGRGGPGSTDLFGGISAARESRRWYYFADLRFRLNGEGNAVTRGNVFAYDVAWGLRPVRTRYEQPDLVMLVEANGKVVGRAERRGVPVADSGGHVLSISPGFLLSIRNWMFKGGLQVPVGWDLNGTQEAPEIETVFGVEFHF